MVQRLRSLAKGMNMAKKPPKPTGTIRPNFRTGFRLERVSDDELGRMAAAMRQRPDGRAIVDRLIVLAESERDRLSGGEGKPFHEDSPAQDAHDVWFFAHEVRDAMAAGKGWEAVAHAIQLGLSLAWARTRAFEPLVAAAHKRTQDARKGHEQVYGSAEERKRLAQAVLERFAALSDEFKDGTKKRVIYEAVARQVTEMKLSAQRGRTMTWTAVRALVLQHQKLAKKQ